MLPGSEDTLFARYRAEHDIDALGALYDRTAAKLLRVAVHLVRRPADAEDLVQATFLAAIERADAYEPGKPVLARQLGILQHKVQALWKREGRPLDAERLTRSALPDPLEATLAAELTAQVDEAIAGLPEAYQSVLRLHLGHKMTAAEIAHALARPPGTVRTQIVRGLDLLRNALPASVAVGVLAGLLPSRGLAAMRAVVMAHADAAVAASCVGISLTAAATLATGIGGTLLMKKLVLALLVGAVCLCGWMVTRFAGESPAPAAAMPPPASLAAAGVVVETASPTPQIMRRAELGVGRQVEHGSAHVRVVWDSDGTPAVGVAVMAVAWGGDNHRSFPYYKLTDARGEFACQDVPAGQFSVYLDRDDGESLAIAGGARTDATIRIARGVQVEGRVVDGDGSPIADAAITLSGGLLGQRQFLPCTRSDRDGRFRVRDLSAAIAASARGYAPSNFEHPRAKAGDTASMVIVLGARGGSLTGCVRAPDGAVAAGATVQIEALDVRYEKGPDGTMRRPPPPLLLTTDEHGAFTVEGVAASAHRVRARAAQTGSAEQTVAVAAGESAHVELILPREAIVNGTVRDEAGAPVAGARVCIGDPYPDFDHCLTVSRADGSFRLHGVTAERADRTVWARLGDTDQARRARAAVELTAGAEAQCDLVIRPPAAATVLRGRVVDAQEHPLTGWRISLRQTGWTTHWSGSAKTDAEGRFSVAGCPPSIEASVFLAVAGINLAVLVEDAIAPGGPELVLRVPTEHTTPATLRGRIVDAHGAPLADAAIAIHPVDQRMGCVERSASDGTFSALLPAVSCKVSVQSAGWATRYLPPPVLCGGETTDLGDLRMSRGSELVARFTDESGQLALPRSASISIHGGDTVLEATPQGEELRSGPLAPGHYVLTVRERGIAQDRFAFTIEEGRDTTVAWRLRVGVFCGLKMATDAGQPPPASPSWSVQDGAGNEVASGQGGSGAAEWGLSLAPGTYTFAGRDRKGRSAAGPIVIATPANSNPPPVEFVFFLR